MAVDPTKSRTVLVIHGVQTADDAQLDQHVLIKDLLQSRLGNQPFEFTTELYRYEDINDAAQEKYMGLLQLLQYVPVAGSLAADAFDLVADVVTARSDTSTAAAIRAGFAAKILHIYASQHPCYVVAHSLGSIYAFDVINELIQTSGLFDRNDRTRWPVQGLLTLGSPIGLPMFRGERRWLAPLGAGDAFFRWVNYWDRNDPVVSGAIFGSALDDYRIAEDYLTDSPRQGWDIQDKPLDTGKQWLMAHVAYWRHPLVGDGFLDLIMN